MQGNIEQVVPQWIQLSQGMVDGEAQIKQVPVSGRIRLEILLAALSNFRFNDDGVVKIERGRQRVGITQSDECENDGKKYSKPPAG